MSKEWTLKNKEKLWEDMCTDVYAKGIIQHLRLELLNDIDELKIDDEHTFTKRNIKTVVKSIVNKRFGIDDMCKTEEDVEELTKKERALKYQHKYTGGY